MIPRPASIRTRILGALFVVVAVPLTAGLISIGLQVQSIRDLELERLTVIADAKVKSLEAFVGEATRAMVGLARVPVVSEGLRRYRAVVEGSGSGSPEYDLLDSELHEVFRQFIVSAGYYDLFLISPTGDVLYSVRREDDFATNLIEGPYSDSGLGDVFDEARTLLATSISTFRQYSPSSAPALFIGMPVMSRGNFLGVVAVQLKHEVLWDLATDYAGLGETGETIVVGVDRNSAVFLAPSRYDPDAAFSRSLTITRPLVHPLAQAASGLSGQGPTIDYRGEPVIAAWRYLPTLRWGLLTKIDQTEAYSSSTQLTLVSLLLGLSAALVAGAIAVAEARSITGPIQQMTVATRQMSSGESPSRVDHNSSDEVGELVSAFNQMADDLENSHTELQSRSEALARSNAELERFAYVASHDLKEPLRTVSGFSQLLVEKFDSVMDEEGQEFADFVLDGTSRMQGLIDDLLSYSRVGSKGINPVSVDLDAVAREVVLGIDASIKESGAEVEIRSLPTVYADRMLIGRLLQNLIGNSIKYRSDAAPEVVVSARSSNGSVEISVSDNGLGVRPEFHQQIFLIFQRLHDRESYSGSGLGLAICKKIVEMHHGTIWIESEEGAGSTFRFTLPKEESTIDD